MNSIFTKIKKNLSNFYSYFSRPYDINPQTGDLFITDRIDYESSETKVMTFDLAVFDAGVPQKSAMAKVTVNIGNLNDESPVFEQPEGNF